MSNRFKGIINYDDSVVFGPSPTDEDYEIIKNYISPDVKRDDIFVYKVRLCDNDIDRDNERFTDDALKTMTDMYVGKIGIEDHNPTIKNAHSRIYKTELVESDEVNADGTQYKYVLGYAYTIANDKNRQLIEDIKSGIKKEVSVGVSNKSRLCSICNTELGVGECEHNIGQDYNGVKCVGLLDDIDDVYEWSFVAVPAQRKAGVIKRYNINKEARHMRLKDIALKICKSADIAQEDVKELMDEIDKVEDGDTCKELEAENRDLKEQLDKALKEIEEAKAKKTEHYIDTIIDSMEPVNDKMKALAKDAIRELIEIGDDGELTDESEEAIKKELGSEDYAPMFKGCNKQEDEVVEVDVEDKTDKSKRYNKGITFTHNNSTVTNKKYTQETGVMGIRFKDK